MSKTETQEKLIEIGTRVKGKGDTWEMSNFNQEQKSLTEALEAWFQLHVKVSGIKPKAFRLDLAQGKLYAIFSEEVEIQEPEPKKYSIYGDYQF
jgi:hypothetical protein